MTSLTPQEYLISNLNNFKEDFISTMKEREEKVSRGVSEEELEPWLDLRGDQLLETWKQIVDDADEIANPLADAFRAYFAMGWDSDLEPFDLEQWSRIEDVGGKSRDVGIEETMTEIFGKMMEGYHPVLRINVEGEIRHPHLHLLKVNECQEIHVDGRIVTEILYDYGKSFTTLDSHGSALPERGEIFIRDESDSGVTRAYVEGYVREWIGTASHPMYDSRTTHSSPQGLAALLYQRSFDEDEEYSKESYINWLRVHEREHIRFTPDDDEAEHIAHAGFIRDYLPEGVGRKNAITEVIAFVGQLCKVPNPYFTLGTLVRHSNHPQSGEHHHAARAVLHLLCDYASEKGWMASAGTEELMQRLKGIHMLNQEQIHEAAGHCRERFYEFKIGS